MLSLIKGLFRPFVLASAAFAAFFVLLFFLGTEVGNAGQAAPEKQERALDLELLTPEDIWELGRISSPRVSPDNTQVLFQVTEYDLEENTGADIIHVVNRDGKRSRRISPDEGGDSHARWRPDARKIGFIHDQQLWEMNPDGSGRRQISHVSAGITGFEYSPDQSKILFTSPVPADRPGSELFQGLDKAGAVITDELMYRHWDSWVDSFTQIFTADYSEEGISSPENIMQDLGLESPLRPFGGTEQIAWSPDSRFVAYTARDRSGREYALTTDSRIMLYDLNSGQTRTLSTGRGYDMNPAFSPDGGSIAWLSMATPGYEADKNRLMVMDLGSGKINDLTAGFDQDVDEFVWSEEGYIFFTSLNRASTMVYGVDPHAGNIEVLTDGGWTYSELSAAGDRLVALKSSMSAPAEVFLLNPVTGREKNISRINDEFLSRFDMGQVREMRVKAADGQDMMVMLILPPGFDPDKKYPALLYCQGGPESPVDHYWSYRWNFQTLAAAGYVIVAPARRGVPGFGQKWKEGVLEDWGGLPMQDLLRGIDAVAEKSWVDEDRLAAVGPSFGGYSIYWLAGNHEGRFRALVAHDGIFHLESMYAVTEETFFLNKQLGGPFWEKDNDQVQSAYAASPHNFVRNWDTPLLVIHGGRDYRVPDSQGLGAFNAARLKGVPARLLYFPNENHWVMSPQNSVLWYRTVIDWLDRWIQADRG
ncbi:MAG: prolyl oligopeptidase family serine peptidase [Thermodesulfobacteriota bacterium]